MESEEIRKIKKFDYRATKWMYTYGKPILRFSLALIFIWFGYLKLIDDSPAEDVVAATAFWFDPDVFIYVLGVWEILIGLFLCFRRTIRIALILLIFQMPGTFLPLVLLPDIAFREFPLVLTMEGQYIIKNIVLIGAAIVVGGTIRERKFVEMDIKSADTEESEA